jgi:iron complex transport system substrate-binding protein
LRSTDARRNNRVYEIDVDLAGRPGPRIVDALEKFAQFIHPELFMEG